jgi:hypothetical protein
VLSVKLESTIREKATAMADKQDHRPVPRAWREEFDGLRPIRAAEVWEAKQGDENVREAHSGNAREFGVWPMPRQN